MNVQKALFGVAFIISACKSAEHRSTALSDAAAIPQGEASETKFDILDTAFLLPFPTPQGFAIKARGDTVTTPQGMLTSDLMGEAAFQRLPHEFFEHLGPGTTWQSALDRLYITGFRYDPCFPMVNPALDPNGPGCAHRAIRLVGQFIDFASGKASPASMHILFLTRNPTPGADPAVDVQKNNAIIKALKGLKRLAAVPTNGKPLGVHPGFYGARAEAFGQQVKTLILASCNQQNFFATSIFFKSENPPAGGSTTWSWGQFIMKPVSATDPRRQLTQEPTTGATGQAPMFSRLILAPDGSAKTIPGGAELRTQTADLSPLLQLPSNPSDPDIERGVTAADLMENPMKMTIPGGDCAGCHVATQARLNALSRRSDVSRSLEFKPSPGITNAIERSILETMATQRTADPQDTVAINFGYHGNKPSVSQRTANEAAQVTLLINESMWRETWGPTPSATTDTPATAN